MTKIVIGPVTSAKELRDALANNKYLDDQWSLCCQLNKIDRFLTECAGLGIGVSISFEIEVSQ
jgi:hypothetical protein